MLKEHHADKEPCQLPIVATLILHRQTNWISQSMKSPFGAQYCVLGLNKYFQKPSILFLKHRTKIQMTVKIAAGLVLDSYNLMSVISGEPWRLVWLHGCLFNQFETDKIELVVMHSLCCEGSI